MIEVDGMMYRDLERILISREEIAAKVRELGRQITLDYAGKSPVMLCVLKGGVVFFTDLVRAVDLPLTMEFMVLSSYGSSTKSSGNVKVIKDLDEDIRGKDVIIVEDIVDSGNTLKALKSMLDNRGAASIRIAALMDKPGAREDRGLTVDYSCFEIPNEFVVGYGLDYNQLYRNLPDIGVLRPKAFEQE